MVKKLNVFGAIVVLCLAACGDSSPATDDAGPPDAAPLPELPVQQPVADAPADPLAGTGVQSCPVYLDERCSSGVLEACHVYDTGSATFVPDPSPLWHRVLLYERWYDLYHQPVGQTADRVFTGETLAGTPEAEWGAVANFDRFAGSGDSAIWSGVALNAYALRYLQTGTEADYQRMERKVRHILTLFDVTGIPGYLARRHGLVVDPAAPNTDRFILFRSTDGFDHRDHPLDPAVAPDLPAEYTDGITDAQSTVWPVAPWWHGNPSIDQYSGPMTSFPLVWGLLRDQSLKDRITRHLTCYLNRLHRIEIINLQQNQDALDAVTAFFAGYDMQLDPDDIDFTALDTVVGYVSMQVNSRNEDTFDRTCPDAPALTPHLLLDATDPDFIVDMLNLGQDMQSRDYERNQGIDHFYIVSVRGGDAMHLMHLATMAYYFTGDDVYREFLYRELIGNLHTDHVAYTMGAFIPPPWCRSFYGTHITIGPFWDFLNLLGDSPLRTEMQNVMEVEGWQKLFFNLVNAKFDLMYAGTVPDAIATAKSAAIDRAVTAVRTLGGNGGVLDDPRRTYTLDRGWVLQNLPAGVEAVCPTESQRAMCEDGFEVFGVTFPGEDITVECTGAPGECPVGDGCAEPMADTAMPMEFRVWEDFIWQRNPFKLGRDWPVEGEKQSPGLDLIEAFWLARTYGHVSDGAGQVLAWEAVGTCP